MDEQIKVEGAVSWTIFGPEGKRRCGGRKNMVVMGGKTALAQWLAAASQSGPFMPYIAVGTGADAVEASQSALVAQVAISLGATSSALNVFTVSATFGAGVGTGNLREAGLFQSNGGTMFSRALITLDKGADESAVIDWNVTFS
jgi:hypothetical protein